jgi:uncharacterized membrane protein
MTGTTRPVLKLRPLAGPAAFAHAAVFALCVGYSVMAVVHRPPLAAMLGGSLLSTAFRSELLLSLGLWSLATAVVLAAGLRWAQRGGRRPAALGELVAGLWPLTLAPLACYAFNIPAWSASPVLLYAVTTACCGYCVLRTEFPDRHRRSIVRSLEKVGPWVLLGTAIAAYVFYVSIHTIHHHWSLGTSAFDLGIQENILWNTVHGDILYSSLMGGNYLGTHTSLVLILAAPIYALAPATETLLVLQAMVLGLAALPLYLLARKVLENNWQGVLIAMIWLTHPAVAGANFYDFHPIAFSPLFLFTAVHFWWCRRWRPFWISIALLLSVKEELSIIVVLLGIVTLMSGNRRQGLQIAAVGAVAYAVLQHLVIPHFAGGAHSYSWYYTDMIPSGEGPRGLVTTALLNPFFTLKFALTQPKLLYVFQLFAPLALLPFFTARGVVLISYGLAATLLASRPPLHQIGFQYALTLLALGFVGALLALDRCSDGGRRRALTAAVLLTVVTCFHYGMIWPRHNFTGGFSAIDFDYSARDRERYRELMELVGRIPENAAVLAGENLVPHVAQRRIVETTRHVHDRKYPHYDFILVVDDGDAQRLRRAPGLDGLRGYGIAGRSGDFTLFEAKADRPPS